MFEIGDFLREARETKGYTQIQVMKLTGINNKSLSGYENGIAQPDLDTLSSLLKLYDVSADKMLGIDTQNNNQKMKQNF